jgi:hypothetical protein
MQFRPQEKKLRNKTLERTVYLAEAKFQSLDYMPPNMRIHQLKKRQYFWELVLMV